MNTTITFGIYLINVSPSSLIFRLHICVMYKKAKVYQYEAHLYFKYILIYDYFIIAGRYLLPHIVHHFIKTVLFSTTIIKETYSVLLFTTLTYNVYYYDYPIGDFQADISNMCS